MMIDVSYITTHYFSGRVSLVGAVRLSTGSNRSWSRSGTVREPPGETGPSSARPTPWPTRAGALRRTTRETELTPVQQETPWLTRMEENGNDPDWLWKKKEKLLIFGNNLK